LLTRSLAEWNAHHHTIMEPELFFFQVINGENSLLVVAVAVTVTVCGSGSDMSRSLSSRLNRGLNRIDTDVDDGEKESKE